MLEYSRFKKGLRQMQGLTPTFCEFTDGYHSKQLDGEGNEVLDGSGHNIFDYDPTRYDPI